MDARRVEITKRFCEDVEREQKQEHDIDEKYSKGLIDGRQHTQAVRDIKKRIANHADNFCRRLRELEKEGKGENG